MKTVCIFGPRDFGLYPELERYCDAVLERFRKTDHMVILCSAAWDEESDTFTESVGRAAVTYARRKGHQYVIVPPTEEAGPAATRLANKVMAEIADVFIGFWDHEDSDTAHMIEQIGRRARKMNLPVKKIMRLRTYTVLQENEEAA